MNFFVISPSPPFWFEILRKFYWLFLRRKAVGFAGVDASARQARYHKKVNNRTGGTTVPYCRTTGTEYGTGRFVQYGVRYGSISLSTDH